MRAAPRLLPLVAVAVGGMLAVKALSGVVALPDLLSAAQARAEAPAGKAAPTIQAKAPPLQTPAPAAKPPVVCAPSLSELAKEASLSPAELQTLQSLQARRGQLDQREKDMDLKLQLLSAAELKLDGKLRTLQTLKGEMQGLMGQGAAKTDVEIDRLVIVYQKMKPRDAAAVMATLEDRVRVPVAAKMKEAALAAILSQMPTLEAKKLTESLARRFAPAEKAMQTAQKPPNPPAPAGAVDPLADPADSGSADAAASKPAKTKVKAIPHARAARRRAVPTAVIMPPAAASAVAPKPAEKARVADAKPPAPSPTPVVKAKAG